MNARMRSPSYPSTSLSEAIEMIGKLHRAVRTNSIDREVAAKELGYTGISGRSATVLSNLIQYGLLEKSGKNEVRVSARAVEILHPDSEMARAEAIRDAAEEPELFQRVKERFADGMPSANVLHSFFVKEGFTDTAIPSAIRAFHDTFAFVQNANANLSGGHLVRTSELSEAPPNRRSEKGGASAATRQTLGAVVNPARAAEARTIQPSASMEMPEYRIVDDKIWLGGVVANQEQAAKLVDFINRIMPMLRKAEPSAVATESGAVSSSSEQSALPPPRDED